MAICTRFAPSPTGYLHIGSVRTALYSWLYARHVGGKFILRIEDTDRERSSLEAVEVIFAGLTWAGLTWDEEPVFQTNRFARYREVADKLLADGGAYRCRCSKERLDSLRQELMEKKQKPKYDGHCRNLNLSDDGIPYVIRFKNPLDGVVTFNDRIKGQVETANSELDDLIIVRMDGSPTYNFTVVVDDWDMGITDVIRGDDHISNTPKQINILAALGAKLPTYAHIPMILGGDGKRLSKRHGAVSIMQYKEQGFLPQALLNYLIRLGWSHQDQEIFSLQEMIDYFDLSKVQKSAATFNLDKLLWLNQHYIKEASFEMVAPLLLEQLAKININTIDDKKLELLIDAQKDRCKTLQEMAQKSKYFYLEEIDEDLDAFKQHLQPSLLDLFIDLQKQFENLLNWERTSIHELLQEIAVKQDLKLGKIAQPLRVAVTGSTVSPSIDVTLELIGKRQVLKRLTKAIKYMQGT
jgi:glutamyl-tRNA synthetase